MSTKEQINLIVDGGQWAGWKSCEVSRQIDALCTQFALGLTDRWTPEAQPMALAAGMPCELKLMEQPFLSGWLDKADFVLANADHTINVSGRDRTCDLVDCSAMNSPGQWRNIKITRLALALAEPFGIEVRAFQVVEDLEPFPTFKLEEGETAFEALDRACKQKEVLALSTTDGRLVLLRTGTMSSETELVQGVNILEASASYDMTDRFSDYIVKGQRQGNDQDYGLTVSQVRGEAVDESVQRYRPYLIQAENQVNPASAVQRAKWEASTRAARAVTVGVTVQGWRQNSGSLWEVNLLTAVDLPFLKIQQELLTSKVTFSLTLDGGFTTKLELKDPKAFEPEPPKKKGGGGGGKPSRPELQQASADSAWSAHKEKTGEN
jgi:prophage tail gpP-like protein